MTEQLVTQLDLLCSCGSLDQIGSFSQVCSGEELQEATPPMQAQASIDQCFFLLKILKKKTNGKLQFDLKKYYNKK